MPRVLPVSLLLLALASGLAVEATPVPPAATPPAATPPATTPPSTTPPAATPPVARPAAVPAAPVVRPAPPARLPLPQADAIDAAQKAVRESFKDDYTRTRKPEERLPLARKLLDQAVTMVGSDTERLAMLREATELAARAGDTALALEAFAEQVARFVMPQAEERLRILTLAVVKPATIESALAAGEALCALADDGIADDNYPFALRAAKEADTFSRRLKDPTFTARTKSLVERAKQLGDEFDKLGEITDLLGNTPPDAHQRYGRFLCFFKGDWVSGLPHLAAGDDAVLKAIAENELAAGGENTDAGVLGKVADSWWDLAQKQRPAVKEEILAHAQSWYRRAASGLSGAARAKSDKRLEDIERMLTASGRHSGINYPHGAVLLLTCERDTLVRQDGKLTQLIDGARNQRVIVNGAQPQSGTHGTALTFGPDSWLDVGSPKELQIAGSQTIAFWINPTELGARRNPFNKNYNAEGTMTLEVGGTINFFYGIIGKPYTSLALSDPLVIKQWAHVAIVRDITAQKLIWYKNGKPSKETVFPYAAVPTSPDPVLIGKGYAGQFLGQMDEIGIWPRALTAQEVQAMYTATAVGR